MLNLMVKGGWIMGLILACSVVSLTVIIERLNKFWEVGKRVKNSAVGPLMIQDLEKNIDILGIIAHVAPLLGLLGTVVGMIRAFMRIEELAGRVNASVLAGGIWEALLTTAFGLAVAIPSFVMYHYFNRKVDNYTLTLEKEKEFEG